MIDANFHEERLNIVELSTSQWSCFAEGNSVRRKYKACLNNLLIENLRAFDYVHHGLHFAMKS